ncbi:MAG TPA: hypothetical protein VK810_01045 [Dongiaceae bacterium]|nr:hypothetical protein [Dongiaceae bacterium]
MKKLIPLLLIAVCVSCASTTSTTPTGYWSNPNKTPEQAQEDRLNCDMMRQVAYHPPVVSGGLLTQMIASSQEQQRLDNIFSECMMSKGYVFVAYTNKVSKTK